MKKLLILATLAAASWGVPALAQSAPAATAIVHHSDLDLTSERGTRTLDRRIWRAVVEVCGTASDFDLAGKNDVRECRRDTLSLASRQAGVVVASATRGEPIRVSSAQK